MVVTGRAWASLPAAGPFPMTKLLGITLGIMTALGGSVDIGQIVFATQAGALFGYGLMWALVLGTAAMIVYLEMCGRVAVVAREPVFSVVRTRLGARLGLVMLIAATLLNLITCAAELGGVAIVLRMLTGWPERLLLVGAAFVLVLVVFLLRFEWIERTFGLTGLLMIVFAVSAVALHPNWKQLGLGMLPSLPPGGSHQLLLYGYFAVGIFSAVLMEYEVHFYSSGAIEEDWTRDDLRENFFVASIGSVLGGVLTAALVVMGALLFRPHGIFPQTLALSLTTGASPFGRVALIVALLGALACLGGATVETALSGAYNVCQFWNLRWGKNRRAKDVPAFAASWIAMFGLALIIVITGVRPLQLVNISVIVGMAIMPLTYYPILRAAADKNIMGEHVNRPFDTVVGTVFLFLITIAALAAIPLMIVTG